MKDNILKKLFVPTICFFLVACSGPTKTDIDSPISNEAEEAEFNEKAILETPLMTINDVGVTYMRSYDELVVKRCTGSVKAGDLMIDAQGTESDRSLVVKMQEGQAVASYFTSNGLMSEAVNIDLDGPIELDENRYLEFSGRDPSGRPLKAELRCGSEASYSTDVNIDNSDTSNGLTDAQLNEYHKDKWEDLTQLEIAPWLRCEIMGLEKTSFCHETSSYAYSDKKTIKTGFNKLSLDSGYPSNALVTAILVVKDTDSPTSERADPTGEKWVSDLDIQVNGQSVGFLDEQFFGLTDVYELSIMPADKIDQNGSGFYMRVHMGTGGATGPYTAQYLIDFEDCSSSGGERKTPYIAQQMRWSDVMGEGSLIFSQYGSTACQ